VHNHMFWFGCKYHWSV